MTLASARTPRAVTLVAAVLAAAAAAAAAVRGMHLQRVSVHGESMAPALVEGDRLVVVAGLPLRPGCLVAVRDPRQAERLLLKRVHSTGPEGIDVRGDASERSTDSRTFGPVHRSLVEGRVIWRYGPPARAGRVTATGSKPVVGRVPSRRMPQSRSVEHKSSAALVPLRPPVEPPAPEPGGRLSDVDTWGRSAKARERLARVYGPLYRHWFRADWEGLEKIPTAGGALLVANHAGALPIDAPLIMHGIETELQRAVYGLADYFFRGLPFVGTMWARGGGVPAHPDNAYRLLHDQDQLALVFPEGSKGTGKLYSERYKLRRFGRGGFVEIAMRAGVPVVPIVVIGSEETMPTIARSGALARALGAPYMPLTANMLLLGPLGLLGYFPAKIRFRVLDPVHFDVAADQERYPRSLVFEQAEKIRQSMQQEIYDMLRHRRSIWFG